MSSFTAKLAESAQNAAHAPTPTAKIGPNPPSKRARVKAPAIVASALDPAPSVLFRPFVDDIGLERAMERAGVNAPAGTATWLIHIAEEQLAGRALDSLNDAERNALADALRAELARKSPGATRRQKKLRDAALRKRFPELSTDEMATTSVRGGVWIFWWSPSREGPLIWGESFVPTKPGTPVPTVRPDPLKAGIKGKPRWGTASGTLSAQPPTLPTKPAKAPSGLSPEVLDRAPDLVFDELRRARLAALEAAERYMAPLPLRAKPGHRRAGTRITSIEQFAPKAPGGDWDELTVVQGHTGPEIERMSSYEMDKVLPPQRELPAEMNGMARLHVFGTILGDETLTGLAYAPHEAVNLVLKDTAETFARWDAKRAQGLNLKAGMPVKVSQYVKYRRVQARKLPFVRTVRFDFTLESGQIVTAVIDIPPTMWDFPPSGKIDFFVLPGA